MQWLIDIVKEWIVAQGYATEAWVLAKVYATEAWVIDWFTPVNVSGGIDPDATCTYFKAGTYTGQNYYRRADGAWFIWWNGIYWTISAELGVETAAFWRGVPFALVTGNYTPFGTASGTATVATGYKYLCTSFVDRGDPAALDFTKGDLLQDNAWHDLDLSAIVPAGAKAVLIALSIASAYVNKDVKFRKNGVAPTPAISNSRTQVANIYYYTDNVVAVDADRKIEYLTTVPPWIAINIVIKGWWL